MRTLIKKSGLLILMIFQVSFYLLGQDFEVSPAQLIFNAEPGQSQALQISIFNHASEKATYNITLGDYQVDKDGKKLNLPAGTTENSLFKWMSIFPPAISLNPNEEGKITVSIQAPSGDYSSKWANIFIRTVKEQTSLNADKNLNTGLMVSGQIIISAIQSPKSNTAYKIKIRNITELPSTEQGRIFTAVVDNIGEKIANCKVTLIASNLVNAEEIKLDEIKFESYPDSQLNIKLRLGNKLVPGKYALAAILDYGSKSNLEGTQMLIDVQ
ncbi:MAG: hypothetical protein U0W24_23810 [Bacteroidales bacterium]